LYSSGKVPIFQRYLEAAVPSKHWHLTTRLYGIESEKTIIILSSHAALMYWFNRTDVALFTIKILLWPRLNLAAGIVVAGDPNLDDKG
jgi:hypothetical protein